MTEGTIIKALSGFYYVQTAEGPVTCKAKGQFRHAGLTPLVGDRVQLEEKTGTVTAVLPRTNSFIRPAVANVDAVVFTACAVKPVTDPFLIDRVSVIAASAGCRFIIVLNKCDLDPADELYRIYKEAGFETFRTSAATGEGLPRLLEALQGKRSVFTGNSGVGKSSLLNRMVPGADIETGEISEKLGRGRHTTRHVEFYSLGPDTFIADTPGFASFEVGMIADITSEELQYDFLEFEPFLGKCRFNDCCHLVEPDCAVTEAVKNGQISASRHASYVRLYDIVKNHRPWE